MGLARLAVPIAAAVLVVSCTERTAPADAASFGFSNGPESPGESGIFRSEVGWFEVARDESAGLISLNGWPGTVASFCDHLAAGDVFEFAEKMDQQTKPHIADEVNALLVDRETSVQILELASPAVRLCRDLREAPVLYSGTAAFHRTDNNLTETGTEGGRANSFGWTSQGMLEEVATGRRVHYNGAVRLLINPTTDELTVILSRINVH